MNLIIRQEQTPDRPAVFHLLERAFRDDEYSDHREQFLVEKLRNSSAFIPELSIVAETENKIVGYILLTRVIIKDRANEYSSLALAPLAVLPEYQNKGIGSNLIHHVHKKARELNYSSVLVLGHQHYYPKFGYRKASDFNISFPFEVPEENCMVTELKEGGLRGVCGMVHYAQEFLE